MSFCEIIIVGNVGRDPELRYTSTGDAVCSVSVAVNRNRRQGDEWVQDTTWYDVAFWREKAERVVESVTKGTVILVTSNSVEADVYIGREGEPRTSLKLSANTYRILSRSTSDSESNTPTGRYANSSSARGTSPYRGGTGSYDGPAPNVPEDDIPF